MGRHCWNWPSFLAMLLFLAVVTTAQRSDAGTFPYRARVVDAGAQLRSGPGDDYYVTDTLPEGAPVEVYQERPDGWCAIRPPEGSFGWVFARHVRLRADGLGEINKDDVASRVGSRLGRQRDAVQVHLAKGEVVEIVGTDEEDGQTWYKIAPPSGEFRWIHESSLGREGTFQGAEPSPGAAAHDAAAGDEPSPRIDAWRAAPGPPSQDVESAAAEDDGQVIPASHDKADDKASDNTTPVSPSPWQPVSNQPASTQSAAADAAATPPGPGNSPSDDFARQVNDLELRLSQIVAEPVVTWRIDQLEKEGEQLLSRAENVAQRDAVKGTLAKIDRFAAIQRRYQWTSAGRPAAAPQQAISSPPQEVGASQTPAGGVAQFDAVGILRPVISRRPGAPQFALVNEQGQVVSFVTATPDVNLQPYLGRRIGIIGSRGYMPEYQRAHVTASRVAPLGEHVLR